MTDTGHESNESMIHWHCSGGKDCAWSQELTYLRTTGTRHSDINDQCYQCGIGGLLAADSANTYKGDIRVR
jgi:hypothetical protein